MDKLENMYFCFCTFIYMSTYILIFLLLFCRFDLVLKKEICWKNQSIIIIFFRLTGDPHLKIVLFLFLFLNYTLSLMGNLIITLLNLLDPFLRTPLYFFVQNFSFLEIILTTVCVPDFW